MDYNLGYGLPTAPIADENFGGVGASGLDHLYVSSDDINMGDSASDNPIAKMIMDSRIYKQAYEIFSSDVRYGVPFLRDLEMIPYSFSIRDENFWDEVSNWLGGTSDYENLINDAFSNAMDEIRVLVQNYYTFINTLPVEQVQQMAEAGINSSVTGEGINPSSMDADPVAATNPNLTNSAYNNQALSSGITSFVEFINSMSSLGSTVASIDSLKGMLDLAQREGYNAQELHDIALSKEGVTSTSPYRIIESNSSPVISDNAAKAAADAKVSKSKSVADANALDSTVSVQVGNDPNNVAVYEEMTGVDVLNEASRFKLVNNFADVYTENLRSVPRQLYAQTLGYLEGEYNAANYGAMIAEQGFNMNFFSSRNGITEGIAQTNIVDNLRIIRQCEADIKSFDAWMAEYKMNTLNHWSNIIDNKPSLAPFFYKAMFDFDMSDTFYHMSPWTMGLKYGMETLDGLTSVIGNIMGFLKPKMPRMSRSHTVSSGPRGTTETMSETINTY